jgi:DNA-binding CsgD family transcriptional regulator/PAS domain-containing protein
MLPCQPAVTEPRPQPRALRVEGHSDLRTLVRQSPLPTWLLSLETRRIVEVSETMTTLFNCRRDQLLRRDATDFVVDQAVARSRLGLLATGELDSYRVQATTFRRPDGTQFDVDACLTAYAHETSRRLAVGVLLPVTESPLPLSGGPDTPGLVALGTVDDDWRIDRISASIEQLLGHAAAYVVGQAISTLVEPADWPNLLIAIGSGLQGQGGATTRLLLRGADGRPRHCRALIEPLAGPSSPRLAFSFAFGVRPVASVAARAWELEGHIRRIAREVAASGALDGLTAMPTATTVPAMAGLSARELEIVTALLAGDRVPMIAERMFLSQSTVRNHLTSVYRKQGVRSQQQLLRLLRVQVATDAETGDFA